jgi:hypothetical protein
MTYQQYVKARSQHLKQQGTTLKGTERMKQIANEWNGKGKGIAMAGGSFMDILKQLPDLIMGGQLKDDEMEMVGGGAKLNKLKKLALKFGVPLATAGALMALGQDKGIDLQGGFDSRNFQPFVEVDMERNTPMMDENEITGMGLKKKGKKMTGKGAKINKIGQIAKKFGIPLLTAVAILASGAVAQNEAELLLKTVLNTQRGGGVKMNKLKNLAKKYALPVATVLGVLVSGKKLINFAEDYVNEQFGNFEGEGVKKKMTKKQMKQMQGEGFFSDIGDAVSGFFSDPVEAITKTAGMTLSALPFIL